jgi:hypothetical protein
MAVQARVFVDGFQVVAKRFEPRFYTDTVFLDAG